MIHKTDTNTNTEISSGTSDEPDQVKKPKIGKKLEQRTSLIVDMVDEEFEKQMNELNSSFGIENDNGLKQSIVFLEPLSFDVNPDGLDKISSKHIKTLTESNIVSKSKNKQQLSVIEEETTLSKLSLTPNRQPSRRETMPYKDFDPDTRPANIKLAKLHEEATSVGLHDIPSSRKKYQLCPCCGMNSDMELIPICCKIDDLKVLKNGFPLYFNYLKWVFFVCVLSFLVLGLYLMVYNGSGDFCQANRDSNGFQICGRYFNSLIQACNQDYSKVNNIEKVLSLMLFFMLYICWLCFKYHIEKSHYQDFHDENSYQSSQYALILIDLPKTELAEDIKSYLQDYGLSDRKIVLQDLNCAYNLDEWTKIEKIRNSCQKKLIICQTEGNDENEAELKAELKVAIDSVKILKKNLMKGTTDSIEKFTGTAFVIFQTKKDRNQFLKEWNLLHPIKHFIWKHCPCLKWIFCRSEKNVRYYKDRVITVKKAPNANNILWENFGYQFKSKLLITFINSILCLCLLLGSTYVIFKLKEYQINRNSVDESEIIVIYKSFKLK